MTKPQTPKPQAATNAPGFFAIFPILAKILWRYGRKLFNLETLAALEKKQGAGSGERSVEEALLEQALERNKHHYHVPMGRHSDTSKTVQESSLSNPVIVVKGGGNNEHNR